ncbi:MAG: PEGA domain-containing protein [Candidatus Marinimicrobia bacterium]|nr:PEGA domain-containing protein [Candidatus Neomarinimicrobiota bacterium]
MKKKVFGILISLILLPTIFGCATIVSGGKQNISINSNPSAAVAVDGISYTTPVVVELKRGQTHVLTFTKEGYNPVTINLNKSFNPWFVGNIVFGGIPGIIVDFITGAVYKIEPAVVNATLTPAQIQEFGINIEIDGNEYQFVLVDATSL